MAIRDSKTEQLIKDTAKRVFFAEGRINATTQDIADAAGVSRTSLHYYFRSKDVLIGQVFNEAMIDLSEKLYAVMSSDMAFKDKIKKTIDLFLSETIAYPYRETFLITEMLSDNSEVYKQKERGSGHMKAFLKEIEAEMEAGNIKKTNPIQFMMNLFALSSHPLIMRPLQQKMFELSDAQFDRLMNERKELICEIVLR
jgi:AcrR family transcriptional regulator